MSALLLEIQPVLPAMARPGREAPRPRSPPSRPWPVRSAPWLLLVTAYAGLTRTAAACLAGPLPV